MYGDPKRYENDGLCEDEDTEYEDEYEADDFDYIVDDEDENALWDDAEEDSSDDDDTDDPVSYTHLDVYKRQVIHGLW